MAITAQALQRLPAGFQQLRAQSRRVLPTVRRAAFASTNGSQAGNQLQKQSADRALTDSFWGPDVPSLFRPRMGSLFRSLEEDLRTFWNDFPTDSKALAGFGAADVQELDKAFKIKIDLPGVAKEDIKVNIKDRVMSVTGKRESSKNTEDASGFSRRERSFGSFRRQFQLPPSADASAIKAKVEDGVLHVDIPKLESAAENVSEVKVD